MRSSVLAWSAAVSSAVALALVIVTAVQVLNLRNRANEFHHAVNACATNGAYTPGLQGQCLEDYVQAGRR
jgi:hypothetical protein